MMPNNNPDWERDKSILKLVWNHSREEHFRLIIVMIVSVGLSFLTPLTLHYAGKLINHIGENNEVKSYIPYLYILVGIILSTSLLKLASNALMAIVTTNVKRNLELTCIQRITQVPYEYFIDNSNNRFVAAITSEVPILSSLINMVYRSFIRAPITIIIIVGIVFNISYQLALVTIVFLPILIIGLNYFKKRIKNKVKKTFEQVSELYNFLTEWIAGYKVLIGLTDEKYMERKLSGLSSNIAQKSKHSAILTSVQQTTLELISVVLIVILILLVSRMIINNELLIGDALVIPASVLYIRGEMLKVTHGYVQLAKSESAAKRVQELLSKEREQFGSLVPTESIYTLSLKNVSYKYQKSDKPILFQNNSKFSIGSINLIVGPSGIGKTTFAELCMRFRRPTEGEIYLNKHKLSELSDSFIRQNIVLVEQEPFIFTDSIRNNLIFSQQLPEKEILNMLDIVNLKKYVESLPMNLDTKIGKGKLNMSTGEKQRLAIARALLKKPAILILDEFTSNLDLENQKNILNYLTKISNDTLILCISHNDALRGYAQHIYRLNNGHFEVEINQTTKCK
ncbi:MAG: ABC transporter transmembrane domain-containing protein [Bacteroidota bacterium]